MSNIPIYKSEKDLGLVEAIQASHVLAYTSAVTPVASGSEMYHKTREDLESLTKASISDVDLYCFQNILVSTNINKNEDAFPGSAVWAAKDTPNHKPFNLEHKEHIIKGHIYDTVAVDNDFNVIPRGTAVDELPEYFHLMNFSVLYTDWEDSNLKAEAQDIIEKIENGSMFCSMECRISDFDYLAKAEDGAFHIIKRNAASSFLTKHLKIYGGTGEYDGYQLYRLLSNHRFVACGLTETPANEDSIVFTGSDFAKFSKATELVVAQGKLKNDNSILDGVDISIAEEDKTSEKQMADDILKNQLTEMKSELAEAKAEAKQLAEQAVAAEQEKHRAEVDKLNTKVEALETDKSDLAMKLAAGESTVSDLQSKLDEAMSAKTDLEAQLEASKAEQIQVQRLATLVDGGIDKEVATEKVEKFKALSDEQFADLVTEWVELAEAKAAQAATDDKEMLKKKKENDKDKASAESMEVDVEEESDLDLSTASENEGNQEAIKATASWLSQRFAKRQKSRK